MEAMYALDNSFVSHDAEVFATLQKMVDSMEVHQTPPVPVPRDDDRCISFDLRGQRG
jgi:hypothetical protein